MKEKETSSVDVNFQNAVVAKENTSSVPTEAQVHDPSNVAPPSRAQAWAGSTLAIPSAPLTLDDNSEKILEKTSVLENHSDMPSQASILPSIIEDVVSAPPSLEATDEERKKKEELVLGKHTIMGVDKEYVGVISDIDPPESSLPQIMSFAK